MAGERLGGLRRHARPAEIRDEGFSQRVEVSHAARLVPIFQEERLRPPGFLGRRLRVVVELPEPPAGELAETPRCPFSRIPGHAQPAKEPVLPGVSAAMAAFCCEHPDAN
jgi:hypothetical protein